MTADVIITNHHSILLLQPLSLEARDWLCEHTSKEAQWFRDALVVEPRYLPAICDAMEEAGFLVW